MLCNVLIRWGGDEHAVRYGGGRWWRSRRTAGGWPRQGWDDRATGRRPCWRRVSTSPLLDVELDKYSTEEEAGLFNQLLAYPGASIPPNTLEQGFHPLPLPFPLPSLPLPSPPLRSRPPLLWLGGLGERFSSPSGSGQSPATKRYLVNFRLKISPLVATIFRSFSGNETSNYDRHVGCLLNN